MTPDGPADLFSTGSTLLDCALGGGWARRKIINVVGDSSTGKTQLAIEASANFVRAFGDQGARVRYVDAECAFDEEYAERIGLPVEFTDLNTNDEDQEEEPILTVEQLEADVRRSLDEYDVPVLYIVDSWDSLSDTAELGRSMTDGTYGTKAKAMSEFFRRTIGAMGRGDFTMFSISQIRDKLNVTFGRRWTVSGGKALNFYSSQRVFLANTGRIVKTYKGVKRPVGVKIESEVFKNKVGPPHRKATFPIMFSFGVEDVWSMIQWLIENKRCKLMDWSEKEAKAIITNLKKMDGKEWRRLRRKLVRVVKAEWEEIEDGFAVDRRKY